MILVPGSVRGIHPRGPSGCTIRGVCPGGSVRGVRPGDPYRVCLEGLSGGSSSRKARSMCIFTNCMIFNCNFAKYTGVRSVARLCWCLSILTSCVWIRGHMGLYRILPTLRFNRRLSRRSLSGKSRKLWLYVYSQAHVLEHLLINFFEKHLIGYF